MPVDPQVVKTRIRKIEECVDRLREIGEAPEKAYFADRGLQSAAERLLQVAIQSLLDIGSHLIAELGFREAEGYAEIVDILGEEGVLPEAFAKRVRKMAGLRNILVHNYLDVDAGKLWKHLGKLDDFEAFCRHVLAYLKR